MVCPQDLVDFLRGEFIGRKVRIVESLNKSLMGLEGIIVDETKNMFEIESKSETKKVQKNICKFLFVEENLTVDGRIINYRPEDRLFCKFKDW